MNIKTRHFYKSTQNLQHNKVNYVYVTQKITVPINEYEKLDFI
jgi:hypothetical protein